MNYLISHVRSPQRLLIGGTEALGVGETLSAFFKEFFTETDRKLASFKSSIHTIPATDLEKYLLGNKINFVRNSINGIPVPTYYTIGEGEMAFYVDNIVSAITVIDGFKTEIPRFYMWLKNVVKTGRFETSYKWTITKYDEQVGKVAEFIKDLEEGPTVAPMGKVYVNFEEAIGLMQRFNFTVRSIKARDAEVMARDLKNVYEIGNLLVQKIKDNTLVVEPYVLDGIQTKVNEFNELTSIVGASLGLVNELSAVFKSQCEIIGKMK